MLNLSVSQRLELKARAHSIKPVVLIGSSGLTPTVLAEIDRSLKAHDLLKIRVMSDDREARETMLREICSSVNAGSVQHLGKMLVIWRPMPPAIAKAPKRKKREPLTKKQLANRS